MVIICPQEVFFAVVFADKLIITKRIELRGCDRKTSSLTEGKSIQRFDGYNLKFAQRKGLVLMNAPLYL